MSEFETLGILDEISSLVSDRLQVVSYKWLSRNFLVSSNAAKKLLQEFVEKNKDDLEVIYTVAGWLKKAPPTYHIRLVPQPKLTEAKHDFDGNCSVQVYSVQACIPKDPAAIWNAEFVQAEELFKQPITVDNCLRDNRFCGVSNSLVKRSAEGVCVSVTVPQTKGVGISGKAVGSSANQAGSFLQPQQKNLEQASPKLALQSSNAIPEAETDRTVPGDMQNKESDKDKTSIPSKKKGQSDRSSAGAGSSLANLWGRASSKSKSTNSSVEEKCAASKANGIPVSADAQISACENLEAASSDDDEADVNFKRASNDGSKKRRVVLDDSDEEDYENAVNLGSPDVPNVKSSQDSKQRSKISDIKNTILKFDKHDESEQKVKEEIPKKIVKEEIPRKIVKEEIAEKKVKEEIPQKIVEEEIPQKRVKEEKAIDDVNHYAEEEFSALYMGKNARVHERTPDVDASSENKAAVTAPNSPKRRKVLKTRIDERGREVTEVVWEGEEVDTKDTKASKSGSENAKNSNGHAVKVEENGPANPVNRTTTKKSPAVAPSHAAGKAGGKKGANSKDPKQGNILSFFKRV